MTDQHPDLAKEVVNALSEQDDSAEALKKRNQTLQGLLSKVIDLLKEKTNVCLNLEKQNSALHLQVICCTVHIIPVSYTHLTLPTIYSV